MLEPEMEAAVASTRLSPSNRIDTHGQDWRTRLIPVLSVRTLHRSFVNFTVRSPFRPLLNDVGQLVTDPFLPRARMGIVSPRREMDVVPLGKRLGAGVRGKMRFMDTDRIKISFQLDFICPLEIRR
jgi:hypothetical protein